MKYGLRFLAAVCIATIFGALGAESALAARQADVPAWLQAHVGDEDGQISAVVLLRARALYREKVAAGQVHNPCYFAMDATRPNDMGNNRLGKRFYIICEPSQSFRALPSGHGSGRKLAGVANFSNGRACAKNFGNAMDSELTTGGDYLTSNIKKTFKGYFKTSAGKKMMLMRSFVQFTGEGDTANAKPRAIGGHAAIKLGSMCRMKMPSSDHANSDGFVPFGKLVDYSGGRSDGCTSWSPSDANRIMPMIDDNPTTVYIYPQARDINAVAKAVASGKSLASADVYWNADCLHQIGTPKFWRKETLEPVIAQYKKDHPPGPFKEMPICQGGY